MLIGIDGTMELLSNGILVDFHSFLVLAAFLIHGLNLSQAMLVRQINAL
jgi:hypothetical protein